MSAETRNPLLTQMTEAELQATITEALDLYGWVWHHETDSRRSREGFPDLVCVHPKTGWVLFLELKSQRGRVRPAQAVWLEALGSASLVNPRIRFDVVRPSDLDEILAAVRGMAG